MVSDRSLAVLHAIVGDYVASNEPVGSKTIVERHHFGVSAATIRNDMALLEDEADLEVVGEAENGHEAVRLCKQLRPDLVVMDVGMPQLNGMEATRQILADNAAVRVLALSPDSPGQVMVRLDCGGCALLARITEKSAHGLALEPGLAVFAQIKGVAILG